jgi:hypothetical protein
MTSTKTGSTDTHRGWYARKMLSDYQDALQFVEDYFQLNYSSFVRNIFRAVGLMVKTQDHPENSNSSLLSFRRRN